jgi:iron(III) transport system permease protein
VPLETKEGVEAVERSVAGTAAPRRSFDTRLLVLPIVVLIGLAVAGAIVYPLARMVLATIFGETGFVAAYGDLFSARGFGGMVSDTIVYVGGSLVAAAGGGAVLAWAMERTDARIPRLAAAMPLIPLVVPPIGSVIGYIALFAPSSGYANSLLAQVGLGPVRLENMPGLIFVTAVNILPLAYLIVSAALRNLDSAVDEAARVAGAGAMRTLVKVTIPTVRPALVSSALVIVIMSIGAFTYPLLLGTKAEITTASVFVYRLFSGWPPQQAVAVALALLLMVVVQVGVFFQARAAKSTRRAVVAGKNASSTPVALGRWRRPVQMLIMLYVVSAVLPVIGLVAASLIPFRGSGLSLDSLTLDTFTSVFVDDALVGALINSFGLGALAGVIAMGSAAALLGVSGRLRPGRGAVEGMLFFPASIPHTALAAAFIVAFSAPPIVLYGTHTILLVAFVVAFLPQASTAASAALSQTNRELSEAAYVSGAGTARVLWKVILPQVLPGLFAGWMIVFFMSVNEVTMSALLAGPGTPVVGRVSIEYYETGRLPEVAALSLIITVISAVVVVVAGRIIGKGRIGVR